MQDLRISIIQTNIEWHNPKANLDHFSSIISPLSGQSDLVLLPEMFNTGFTMDASEWHESMEGETLKWMQNLANSNDLAIGGSLIIKENNNYFNRFVLVTPQGVVATYDKRHLFRMANEHIPFTAGDQQVVFEYKGWKIRPQICYDLRFPVFARNSWSNGKAEYDLLLYVANWPQARVEAWHTLLKARAIENLSYCIGVNRIGLDGEEIAYNGQSMVVNYLGEVLNDLNNEDSTINITLDKKELTDYRARFPAHDDADTFQLDY